MDRYWRTIIWTTTERPSYGQLLNNHHLDLTNTGRPSSGLYNYGKTIIWTRAGGPSYGKLLDEHHMRNH
jgi:hypothetical protein